MDFFDNEIIRSESAELMRTFEDIQDLLASYKFITPEGGKKYLSLMERLLELQEMIYFRARYSDESDAKEFVDVLDGSMRWVAQEGETDPIQVFRRMRQEIASMKKFVKDS